MFPDRSAGILLHPTSLPSPGGIGDLGAEVYAFADFLFQGKQGLWQILPLSPPGLGNSPYSAISAFAGNPLLVSLARLAERGWITPDRLKKLPGRGSPIHFDEVKAAKLPLLREAAQNFLEAGNHERRKFEDFKRENAWWLEDFVLFDVMRQVRTDVVLNIAVSERMTDAANLLENQPEVDTVQDKNGVLVVKLNEGVNQYSFLANRLIEQGYELTLFKEDEINLETAFMHLTKGITS